MPFKIIAGSFHVVGYSPDGDSVRFLPDNIQLIEGLDGPPASVQDGKPVQLRIEGIDALETHYNGRHQPKEYAEQARDLLMDYAGITNIQWNAKHTQVVSADDGTRGFICARSVDKYGRPIAIVFAGDPPAEDGTDFFLDPDFLESSYNYQALQAGLTYATYYWGFPYDLRNKLTSAVNSAREAQLGLYADDTTTTAFTVDSLADLTDTHVIMPKLFRRVSDYVKKQGTVVGFKKSLEANREPVLEISTANFTHFDTFVEQKKGSKTLRLTVPPEALVFDAMPSRPVDSFGELLEKQEE